MPQQRTAYIINSMNARGHHISSIYMSGGQAKNRGLMQLFADTCSMPVVLPKDSGGAVVLGAAMLGRYAAEAQSSDGEREGQAERLWNIMASFVHAEKVFKCAKMKGAHSWS
ncbi:hypothetical protein B0H34DRAFT_808738 [Crassisporium funariophilum]|nr:hypothetical protein B0H34DRAFT_808738 [Crassisporium funariophilum]